MDTHIDMHADSRAYHIILYTLTCRQTIIAYVKRLDGLRRKQYITYTHKTCVVENYFKDIAWAASSLARCVKVSIPKRSNKF